MHMHLKVGDTIRVWPAPGVRAPAHPDAHDRFISNDGEDYQIVDERRLQWLHELARMGAIVFTDPRPGKTKDADGKDVELGGYRRATHAMHPHEWVTEHGKPAMHLTDEQLKKLKREVHWHLVEGSQEARAKHLAEEAAKAAAAKADSAKQQPGSGDASGAGKKESV